MQWVDTFHLANDKDTCSASILYCLLSHWVLQHLLVRLSVNSKPHSPRITRQTFNIVADNTIVSYLWYGEQMVPLTIFFYSFKSVYKPKIHTRHLSEHAAQQARKGEEEERGLPLLNHTRPHALNMEGCFGAGSAPASTLSPPPCWWG